MTRRALEIAALVVLAAAAIYTAWFVFSFSESRFFTIDEYQYGHATWLVAQGELPYVDFFEHHFPLSYVLHAPFFVAERAFDTSALLLRRIVFGSWLALCVLTAWTGYRMTGNRLVAVLLGFLPVSLGFGLMSAIDYRADNFGAIYLGASLVLLESNRTNPRRGVAILSGVLLSFAAAMTQKVAVVGGGTALVLLAWDGIAARLGSTSRTAFIAHPLAFVAAATATGGLGLLAAGVAGILPAGFETTIVQAIEHENYYEGFSLFEKGYVQPFWEATWPATSAIGLCAAGFLVSREGRFWIAPVAVTLLGLSLVAAPYPYNFVLLCWLVGITGVRGFALGVRTLRDRFPAVDQASALLYLLPLVGLGSQLHFVSGTTTNEHQLGVLRKIATHGERGEPVIDNAGGAMFSPHVSYYYLHGVAHRKMFRDYFESQLVDDYRRSQALFWIRDGRFERLPGEAREYLHRHYVHGGDGLYVLGTRTPATRGGTQANGRFELIRPAVYRFHAIRDGGSSAHHAEHDLLVDGRAPIGGRMRLEAGEHRLRVRPGSPSYVVTPVDGSFFDPDPKPPRYTLMFEYGQPRVPMLETVYDLTERLSAASEHAGAALRNGVIVQRPGSSLRYDVVLPERPRLRGHVRLAGAAPPRGRLVIEVRSGGRSASLVSEGLGGSFRKPGHALDASLEAHAGERAEIEIRFEAGPDDVNRLRWTDLRIDGAPSNEAQSR